MNNKSNKTVEKNARKLDTPTYSDIENTDNTDNATDKPKLKKLLIIGGSILGAITILTLVLVLVFASTPIGRILTKLQKDNSYHMSVTVSNVFILGTVTFEQYVDEDVKYTPAFLLSAEKYEQTVGDDLYVYTKNDFGNWVRTKSEGSDGLVESMGEDIFGDFDDLLNPKNYEMVDGDDSKYKQKDNVEFDGCKNVLITIGENDVTVTMLMFFSGLELPTTIVISQIGEVELTLPEV